MLYWHLTFIERVDWIIKKYNSRLFLMKQLKQIDTNLSAFYKTGFKLVLSYVVSIWCDFISVEDKKD